MIDVIESPPLAHTGLMLQLLLVLLLKICICYCHHVVTDTLLALPSSVTPFLSFVKFYCCSHSPCCHWYFSCCSYCCYPPAFWFLIAVASASTAPFQMPPNGAWWLSLVACYWVSFLWWLYFLLVCISLSLRNNYNSSQIQSCPKEKYLELQEPGQL